MRFISFPQEVRAELKTSHFCSLFPYPQTHPQKQKNPSGASSSRNQCAANQFRRSKPKRITQRTHVITLPVYVTYPSKRAVPATPGNTRVRSIHAAGANNYRAAHTPSPRTLPTRSSRTRRPPWRGAARGRGEFVRDEVDEGRGRWAASSSS